ncbi:MAG TPA: ECF-type sigma factor [Bryobacteraceae bacterium]|jgi:RNA polymerase sigma factor (TIGR02999 family)
MPITELLQRLANGDCAAIHDLMPLVYQELKRLARVHLRREVVPSLETTSLVHEAFLRLARGRHPSYEGRAHFYGIASRLMRQVLVEMARSRATAKRDRGREIALADLPEIRDRSDSSLLLLDAALRWLENFDRRKAQLIEMRYFGGMTAEESAIALSIPVNVVHREFRLAHVWLRKQMSDEDLEHSTSSGIVAL